MKSFEAKEPHYSDGEFRGIYIEEDNIFEILYKIRKETNRKICRVVTASMPAGEAYYRGMMCDWDIEKKTADARLCLDIEHYYLYPPKYQVNRKADFDRRLERIKRFDLAISDGNNVIGEVNIDFAEQEAAVYSAAAKSSGTFTVSRRKCIKILKNANFQNWKSEYRGDEREDGSVTLWSLSLALGEEVLEFNGVNKMPNVWGFLISELLDCIKY